MTQESVPGAAPATAAKDPGVATSAPSTPRRKRRKWPWLVPTIVVVVLLLAWIGVNCFAASWIAHNGYTGEGEPAASATGIPVGEVTIASHYTAWYVAPQPGEPVAVVVHGYQANRSHVIATARALYARGYGLMLPDLPYITGKVLFGGGDRETNEVKQAVDYVHSQSSAPVVLIGYSEGGAESILAAERGAKVDAVVADSSPVSFLSIAAQRAGIPQAFFAVAYVVYPWFSSGASLEDLSGAVTGTYHVPTLVIQGTKDTTVPYADGPELARLTHGQLWTVQGVGHDQALAADPTVYIDRVTSFIDAAVASHG